MVQMYPYIFGDQMLAQQRAHAQSALAGLGGFGGDGVAASQRIRDAQRQQDYETAVRAEAHAINPLMFSSPDIPSNDGSLRSKLQVETDSWLKGACDVEIPKEPTFRINW